MDTADIETALWHYAAPLPADRRDAFCRAVESALNRLPDPGPGEAYRVLREILSNYHVPTAADGRAYGARPHRRSSKLTDAPAIGIGHTR